MSLKHRIQHHIWKFFKPVMVGRFKDGKGNVLPQTRVSNTTHIGHKENLLVANNVFIGHYNFLDASNGIEIGEGCQLTNYVSILTHSSHMAIRLYGHSYTNQSAYKAFGEGSVKLGRYTFVGPHTVLMPGTTIGKGSLVSAFSYAKGIFPDFSIISGNPAKRIGDTRTLDKRYINNNPELKAHYEAWAGTWEEPEK